jgi:hypothetical protein
MEIKTINFFNSKAGFMILFPLLSREGMMETYLTYAARH